MHVIFKGPGESRRLAPSLGGALFERGVPTEVDDETGESLLAQPMFMRAEAPKRKPKSKSKKRVARTETATDDNPAVEVRDGEGPEPEEQGTQADD